MSIFLWPLTRADGCTIANVACHESGIQAVAGRQSGAASVHSCGAQDGRRKLGRNGVGSVSGTVCCTIVVLTTVVLSKSLKQAGRR